MRSCSGISSCAATCLRCVAYEASVSFASLSSRTMWPKSSDRHSSLHPGTLQARTGSTWTCPAKPRIGSSPIGLPKARAPSLVLFRCIRQRDRMHDTSPWLEDLRNVLIWYRHLRQHRIVWHSMPSQLISRHQSSRAARVYAIQCCCCNYNCRFRGMPWVSASPTVRYRRLWCLLTDHDCWIEREVTSFEHL